jgi:penicillin-binding protein 1C
VDSVEAYLQRYQPGPEPRLFQTTRVVDRHGTLLAELWDEGRRTWVSLDQISPHLLDATIATEDATFYVNPGIDPARIAGAALQNAQEGQVVSGASTITMQLARNLFLGPDTRYDQTVDRKMLEAGLAQELTTLFSKDELLEMYLNMLNYGHLAYGPEAAAQTYLHKPAAELTLAEATLLAGLPQQPANLDPFRNFEAAKERQQVVLSLMVRHGYLTQAQADTAFAEQLTLNTAPDHTRPLAPHFVQAVEELLAQHLDGQSPRRAGLLITTTLDLPMQTTAEAIVAQKVEQLRPQHDLGNAALVALHPHNGDILAMVGSADFDDPEIDGQVNIAVSPRQPGSAIKPILYATAFDANLISPATVLWDVPVTYTIGPGDTYTPVNYDEAFHGPVTARTALASSYNVATVKLLDAVSVPRMLDRARAMGLHSLEQDAGWYGLSLTLGGGEVTLLDLTSAFASLANGGYYVNPELVLAVQDAQGRPVKLDQPPEAVQVISPEAAFLTTDILSDNAARTPAFGANSPLLLSRPAAAKTGTTSDFRDNWTVGFTRFLVAGVWAGNSDGTPMRNTSGLTGAAPIWHDFMEAVLADQAPLDGLAAPEDGEAWRFLPPPGVLQMTDPIGEIGLNCPPGVTCRQGGEFFSLSWLEAAGPPGPLADSVRLAPAAPVYVDHGDGVAQWQAYCQVEPALWRPLLALPEFLGLAAQGGPGPEDAGGIAGQPSQEVSTEAGRLARLHAVAWSLRHPTAVNLGPCDQLASLALEAWSLEQPEQGPALQVLVDLAAAMDPDAGPVAGSTAMPIALWAGPAAGSGRYVLAESVTHHDACPGNYIVGQVLDSAGGPVAGVRVVLVDQWGNRAEAISKDGASDYGRYDFPVHYFANHYTLYVVDSAGNPISPAVEVDHLQGSGGDAPCHSVNWRGS